MSLLTAIVPVHKMSGRLEELKHWVCESLKLNIRIILVHDFGDFDTEKELEDFVNAQDSSKLVFISGQFGGPGMARNAAMHQITTEYFCFWDSDDIPLVQNFYEMVLQAAKDEIDIAVGLFEINEDNKLRQNPLENKGISLIDKVALNPGLWRMAFASKHFSEYRFRELRLAEDQLFLVEIDFAERRIFADPRTVYCYNSDSPGSLTKQRSNLSDICTFLGVINFKLASSLSLQSRPFLLVMGVKQALTLVKSGTIHLKLVGLRSLASTLVLSSNIEKRSMLKLLVKWRR
jgi:glycosyltransferase involved in cell wall biosynthesis